MEEQLELTDACGPHCGVITTGKTKHVGHCQCEELCHGRKTISEVVDVFVSNPMVTKQDTQRLLGFVPIMGITNEDTP